MPDIINDNSQDLEQDNKPVHFRLSLLEAKRSIMQKLQQAGIENPMREAGYVLAAGLGVERGALMAFDDIDITETTKTRLEEIISRRMQHEPLARILGVKEFWGLTFKLNEHTLVPRPDTETLVETILKHVNNTKAAYRILDLGTGSGCILLSLLSELTNATGVGIDQADGALSIARENAEVHRLAPRTTFMQSNWFEKVDGEFDIIVSNPPYIAEGEKINLDVDVLNYDPHLALFAEDDGLATYKIIIPEARKHLTVNGLLAVEIGYKQADAVLKLFQTEGFTFAKVINDLGGNPRVVFAYKI